MRPLPPDAVVKVENIFLEMAEKPHDELDEWEWAALNIPKCCHTCDLYIGYGFCRKFLMSPPDYFANSFNQCDEYLNNWELFTKESAQIIKHRRAQDAKNETAKA